MKNEIDKKINDILNDSRNKLNDYTQNMQDYFFKYISKKPEQNKNLDIKDEIIDPEISDDPEINEELVVIVNGFKWSEDPELTYEILLNTYRNDEENKQKIIKAYSEFNKFKQKSSQSNNIDRDIQPLLKSEDIINEFKKSSDPEFSYEVLKAELSTREHVDRGRPQSKKTRNKKAKKNYGQGKSKSR